MSRVAPPGPIATQGGKDKSDAKRAKKKPILLTNSKGRAQFQAAKSITKDTNVGSQGLVRLKRIHSLTHVKSQCALFFSPALKPKFTAAFRRSCSTRSPFLLVPYQHSAKPVFQETTKCR